MTTTPAPRLDVRRAADRARTLTAGIDSRHSFSFGRHYDAANTSYGRLLVNNEDRIQVGAGFETHPHRDTEIVTWVLEGCLVHRDSTGRSGIVRPGLAQRMSAGSGVLHSETNDAHLLDEGRPPEDVHLVQMWVVPDELGTAPGYEQRDVEGELRSGGLVTVASGMARHDGAAVRIGCRSAALHVARLQPGQRVTLPDAPYLHLFVPRGEVDLESAGPLRTGDAVRLTATGGRTVTGRSAAEVLVWEMHAGPPSG